jgi:GBP family porin
MNKSILGAAALLALSGSAMAQSSVTLYGVVDASLENVKGTDSLTRVSSDNLATSRLGFKGVEDIGDGLKANFVLEHAVKVDTGAQGNTPRFWDRASWVGLSSGFGELRLGRIDSSIGLLSGNTAILGAQAYDDFKIAKTFAGDKYRRVDNSITYLLPTFVPGLTSQIQYTLAAGTSAAVGTETNDVDTGKGFSLNAQYVAGPFALGAGYINVKANATGSIKDSAALAYGSYDFGVAKLTGYYDVDSRSGAAERKTLLGMKVGIPLSSDYLVTAGISRVRNALNKSTADDATIIAIKATYNLSKRTAVYGLLTTIDNQDGSNLGVAGVATDLGKNSHGFAAGVRHTF